LDLGACRHWQHERRWRAHSYELGFSEIWARTTFTLDEKPSGQLLVRMMHDEDTQCSSTACSPSTATLTYRQYGDYMGSDAAAGALVQGRNSIAVHTSTSTVAVTSTSGSG